VKSDLLLLFYRVKFRRACLFVFAKISFINYNKKHNVKDRVKKHFKKDIKVNISKEKQTNKQQPA